MGRGRKGSGVERRDHSIRISFTWNGERCRETLELAPTPANEKHAARLVADIRLKIKAGTFVYGEFFPDSERAGPSHSKDNTLRHYGALWLNIVASTVGSNTHSQYTNALKFWYGLKDETGQLLNGRPLGEIPIRELTELELAALIGQHPWASANLKNNYLIPLRGTFERACKDLKISNPVSAIKNGKLQKHKPDPFSVSEAESILDHMARQFDVRVWAYFNWQFYTGMRPEETIALRREDIDFVERRAHVWRVRTGGEDKDTTKTHTSRMVDLNDRAMQSLDVMRNYWREGDHGLVFERPAWKPAKASRGGKPSPAGPWNDARAQNDTYWKPTLKALKIRYRKPYKTRHTYATIGLMNDIKPAYMADQLGHDQKEFYRTYATWINGEANRAQIAKINAVLPSNLSPICPPKVSDVRSTEGEIGRRDWTRTNDPHHVKVML